MSTNRTSEARLRRTFAGFRHRWTRGAHLAALLLGVKAARAATATEAVAWAERASEVGVDLVVQEYVPGPGYPYELVVQRVEGGGVPAWTGDGVTVSLRSADRPVLVPGEGLRGGSRAGGMRWMAFGLPSGKSPVPRDGGT